MEITKKKINSKSNTKKLKNKSIDGYKNFLGNNKNEDNKDKKIFHIVRKRSSPKKIKKENPRDLLNIEKKISKMKSNDIKMPTQNDNLTYKLNTSNNRNMKSKSVQAKVNKIDKKPLKKQINSVVNKKDNIEDKKQDKKYNKKISKKHNKRSLENASNKKINNRSINRSTSRNTQRKKNRRISIKTSVFNNKDMKKLESEILLIHKKKSDEIKKDLESSGIKISGKSNKLLRDIYLYSKISNINITHEK